MNLNLGNQAKYSEGSSHDIADSTIERSLSNLPDLIVPTLEIVQELLRTAQLHTLLLHPGIARKALFKAYHLSEKIEYGIHPLHSEVCLALANNLMESRYTKRASKLLEETKLLVTELEQQDLSIKLRLACSAAKLEDYVIRSLQRSFDTFDTKSLELNTILQNQSKLFKFSKNTGLTEYSQIASFQCIMRVPELFIEIGEPERSASFAKFILKSSLEIFGNQSIVSAYSLYLHSNSSLNSGSINDTICASKNCQQILSNTNHGTSFLSLQALLLEANVLSILDKIDDADMVERLIEIKIINMDETPDVAELNIETKIDLLKRAASTAITEKRYDTAEEILDRLNSCKKPRHAEWETNHVNIERLRATAKLELNKQAEAIKILQDADNFLISNGFQYSSIRLELLHDTFIMAKKITDLPAMQVSAVKFLDLTEILFPNQTDFNLGLARQYLMVALTFGGEYVKAVEAGVAAAPLLAASLYTDNSPLEYCSFAHLMGQVLLHIGQNDLACSWFMQSFQLITNSGLLNSDETEDLDRDNLLKLEEAISIYCGCCVGIATIYARKDNETAFMYYKDLCISQLDNLSITLPNSMRTKTKMLAVLYASESALNAKTHKVNNACENYYTVLELLDSLNEPDDLVFCSRILSIIPTEVIGIHNQDCRLSLLNDAQLKIETHEPLSYYHTQILRELSHIYNKMFDFDKSKDLAEQANWIEEVLNNIKNAECPNLPKQPSN